MTIVTLEADHDQLSDEHRIALNRIYMDWHEIELGEVEWQLQALNLIEVRHDRNRSLARLSFRGRRFMAYVAHEQD